MKRSWTKEEDAYILNNYNKLTWTEMANFLGCAIYTVKKRAEFLGVEVEFKKIKKWTNEEEELLKKYANKYGKKTIAKKLNKSVNNVIKKAREENINLDIYKDPWNDEKEAFLVENINKLSQCEISKYTGISRYYIKKKCDELNIKYDDKRWTKEEENLLLSNYNKCHYSELTKIICGKSKGAILRKARNMNLDVITEVKEKYSQENADFIKENWEKLSINEISRHLGISTSTILYYKNKLDLPDIRKKIKWDHKAIKKLRKLSKSKTIEELAKQFKTSKSTISNVASRNNIKLINSRMLWTEEKINEIREIANNYTLNEACQIISINPNSLRNLANKNKICFKKDGNNLWTDEEINYLISIKDSNILCDIPTIMKNVDKTDEALIKKLKELKIEYIPFQRKPWTNEEVSSIIEDAKKLNYKELVIKYNRSSLSIYAKLRKYGIKPISLTEFWTNEEEELLKKLLNENKRIVEISSILNRSVISIENKINKEKIDYSEIKHWSKEDEEMLTELWNEYNINYIKHKLNRSINSIKCKANELGLGNQFLHQDALRISEISEIFHVDRREIETTWIILGLPYKEEKVSKYYKYKYVLIDDLFKFLENNQFLYNGRDFEENILGMEPEWVKVKRKHDFFYGFEYDRISLIKKKLLQQKKYYLEIEKEKQRDEKVLKKEL